MKNASLAALQDRLRRIAEYEAATDRLPPFGFDYRRPGKTVTAPRPAPTPNPEPAPAPHVGTWLAGTPLHMVEPPREYTLMESLLVLFRRRAARQGRWQHWMRR